MSAKAFEATAIRAVGSALLFRQSPTGGSYGEDIDKKRANRLAEERLDGEALYALLLDVALRAAKAAEHESNTLRWRIVTEVQRLAETSDSLSLHRFIDKEVAKK